MSRGKSTRLAGVPGGTAPGARAPLPERFFRDLLVGLQTSVVVITRDGRIAAINEAAYRVLDLRPRSSDAGRPYRTVLARTPQICRILDGAFDLHTLPNRAELRLTGTAKVIGYTLSLIRDAAGEAIGASLFFKDLTQLEQREERERLRDRLAALGEMAAAIAHEVKNPLAAIEVTAGVLRRQLSGVGDAQVALNEIIHEAKVANGIVMKVLEFVRPLTLELEAVSVADVVREALAVAERQTTRGQAHVRLVLPTDLPNVQADAHQLRQVILNLITNAFESLQGHGTVTVAASHLPADPATPAEAVDLRPAVRVEVTDDGPGIPAEIRDRIFSPFFTTKPRGSGLGLAIVRKILDAHEGRIDVLPRPGGGTRVRVTLPLRTDPETDILDRET